MWSHWKAVGCRRLDDSEKTASRNVIVQLRGPERAGGVGSYGKEWDWLCSAIDCIQHLFSCLVSVSRFYYLRACCEQVLLSAASVALYAQNLENCRVRSRCNLVVICLMVNARTGWKLLTFDLDLWPWELFAYLFSLAVLMSSSIKSFRCFNVATTFSVWRYIFRVSRSPSSF